MYFYNMFNIQVHIIIYISKKINIKLEKRWLLLHEISSRNKLETIIENSINI